MTAAETQRLQELQDAYLKAQQVYNDEAKDNYLAHTGANAGGDYQGKSAAYWQQWARDSDASLAFKKGVMDRALSAYNDYQAQLNQAAQNAFAQNNPELYAQTLQNKDKAEADAKAKVAEYAAQAANYASANSKYIIIGVVLILVIGGIWMFTRKRSKSAA